jgi:competence protein ComEC
MKLPAVPIVAVLVSGIALGLWPGAANAVGSPYFFRSSIAAAVLLIAFGRVLYIKQKIQSAWFVSLLAWFALGISGAGLVHRPEPANYVLRLINSGNIDIHSPLRWRGVLRDEPATLPWGRSYEVELTSVDYQEQTLAISGGLRATYSPRGEEPAPPEMHAGDEVSLVAQARLPQHFRDEGAFDRREYLRAQGVDLTAALRASQLLTRVSIAKPSAANSLRRARQRLRESLSNSLPDAPEEAGMLRAMLLGDRSFLDRSDAVQFQKTGVFHVLVVAGLHVGAFATFLFWLAKRLKISRAWTSIAVLLCVGFFVAVVEQRAPVLRAGLMTTVVLVALLFFRRIELLNSVALAALILLVAAPGYIADASFQLSFLAMFCIAGLALPWLERVIEPLARGMKGWRDVTRDVSHEPRVAQFRIDLRSSARWLEAKISGRFAVQIVNVCARMLQLLFRIVEMIVLTLALQVGMLPLLAREFHRVTLSGPLANLIAVPLTGILVPLGFAVLVIGLFSVRAAALLAVPLRWLATLLLNIVNHIAHVPRWSYRIPGPPVWLVLVFFALAITLAILLRARKMSSPWPLRFAFLTVMTATAAIAFFPFAPETRSGSLELTVLDVGQGDSLLLVSPKGHTILVDGGGSFNPIGKHEESRGPDPGEEAVSAYLWARGFKTINIVALTHAHQDHIGGLRAIFENFHVGTLWIGREVASPQQLELEKLAIASGARVIHELSGQTFDFDGAQGRFLWPRIVPEESAPSAKNDDSLVFRLTYGDRSLLLPGDAEKMAEHNLLDDSGVSGNELHADVLKVGHHGSKNSTTDEFLAAVQPRLAVISAGEENPYGHPSPLLIERLRQAGVVTLRTDENGAVHIFTDGNNLSVECFVACQQVNSEIGSARTQPPDEEKSDQQ